MKIEKIIIFAFIFSILFNFTKNFLILLNVIQVDAIHGILFATTVFFMLAIIFKHKYWIVACIFMGINELVKIPARKSFRTNDSIIPIEKDIVAILIMIGGLFCVIVSSIYLYKFLRLKNYENYYIFRRKSNIS
jgi:hypothetical protein